MIWAEGFLSRLSFGVISFALPIFAYKRLGLSLTQTGFLFSLNLIAEQLFKPLMGWVADRAGLKRTLTVAIALRSVVPLALAFCGLSVADLRYPVFPRLHRIAARPIGQRPDRREREEKVDGFGLRLVYDGKDVSRVDGQGAGRFIDRPDGR